MNECLDQWEEVLTHSINPRDYHILPAMSFYRVAREIRYNRCKNGKKNFSREWVEKSSPIKNFLSKVLTWATNIKGRVLSMVKISNLPKLHAPKIRGVIAVPKSFLSPSRYPLIQSKDLKKSNARIILFQRGIIIVSILHVLDRYIILWGIAGVFLLIFQLNSRWNHFRKRHHFDDPMNFSLWRC